ncbi:putative 3'-N-debenzoyl-2'-deoxytaxol N-benzoyltransferase [Iris pallida]|uniref:3'-N-debenzoyl-2'-deoxytaxol N-benzoyltransferase n=1 Tax=Iris pallida TaxID=29817 RepID=A0AAX6GGK2_IRIPA|nr:putative 3'-N-debenzoyl-2'-deoxytaxol N-benzoyltransferase [Iris pallida]
MSLSVTKLNTVLITPSEPTPSGHDLPLSFVDRLVFINSYIETLHVFGEGKEPAKVIREALAKALVPYYPVAGRIIAGSDGGERRVACTGEGVWFVEASAGCTLQDVGYFASYPLMVADEQLLPSPPPGISKDGLPFMIQVTEFKCGGFTIGLRWSHVMFDGIGVGQFEMAIAEIARSGLKQPSLTPLWRREAILSPPNPQLGTQSVAPGIPYTAFEFEFCTVDISLDSINKSKEQFTKETGEICSTFDVITANLWRSRTRAIDMPSDTSVYVNFPANVRQALQNKGTLQEGSGYYGNCAYGIVVEAPSGKIATCSFSEIVMLIKEAKGRLTTKLSRWLEGDPHEFPLQVTPNYESIYLTDWRLLGSSKADYGWGTPKHIVPCRIDSPVNVCVFLNSPALVRGVRVVTHFVVKEHLEAFRGEISKMA